MAGLYGWSTGSGGVHFHRVAEPIRVAALNGVNTGVGNRLDDEVCSQYDTILTHMLWDEKNSEGWEKLAANGQHRMVFDIDDVMWAPDWKPFAEHYTPDVMDRVWRNIRLAHVVTTPSPFIAEHVSRYNPNVWVTPNTVPEYLLSLAAPPRPYPARPRGEIVNLVGYQGSPSHQRDFPKWLMRELLDFVHARPAWGLHFWGPDEIPGWPRSKVGHTPWQKPGRDYYMSLSMDIGIGPLKPSAFNAGKSSLRAIEYAALGIPAILSAGPAYTGWVEHGTTGYLVEPGESWAKYLNELAANHVLRARMGQAARERAAAWTTERQIGEWVQAWNSA